MKPKDSKVIVLKWVRDYERWLDLEGKRKAKKLLDPEEIKDWRKLRAMRSVALN